MAINLYVREEVLPKGILKFVSTRLVIVISFGMPDYSEKRREGYRKKFDRFGPGPKALQWYSKKAQTIRFLQFVQNLDISHHSILDVGCGFADIIPILRDRFVDFIYTGVDLVPEFIAIAKERYPEHSFFTEDYFKNPFGQKFDFILCSGVLNGNLGNPELTMQFRLGAIRTMFSHCRKSLAFNMVGANPRPKNHPNSKIYYVNPDVIKGFVSVLTTNYIFIENYRPKDFTFIMSHLGTKREQ